MASPIRRDHNRPPAPVAESWRRIESWLDGHLPGLTMTLRPGVSGEDLAKFEAAIGRALPDDVRESWLIHDGQQPFPEGVKSKYFEAGSCGAPGVIFGQELNPLVSLDSMLEKSVLREWLSWSKSLEAASERDDDEVDEGCTSSPEGAIRRRHLNRGWIPLGMGEGNSNYFGVDLDPDPNGVVGQVINFGVDEEEKYVLAAGWAQFLEDYADELEAGNFKLHLRWGFEELDWFLMKRPRVGRLCEHGNYRAWSEAKLDPESPKRRGAAKARSSKDIGKGRATKALVGTPPAHTSNVHPTDSAGVPRPKCRRLVLPPERWGEEGDKLLWTEITEGGEAVSKMWVPTNGEDRAEMERFWEACQQIDWDDPGIHEVYS